MQISLRDGVLIFRNSQSNSFIKNRKDVCERRNTQYTIKNIQYFCIDNAFHVFDDDTALRAATNNELILRCTLLKALFPQ